MNRISVREIISAGNPGFLHGFPFFFKELLFLFIEKIIHQDEINKFISQNSDKMNFELIDELFEYLDFSFQVSSKDRDKIPSEGKLICVSNHPFGGLDGLILLKMFSEIRHDVKIVVNNILLHIENLRQLFIPFDIMNRKISKESIVEIGKYLSSGNAVIFFPAGEVSRFSFKGIKDSKWNKGAVYFAEKYNAPVLPVYISGKNSLFFYLASKINKNLSIFLLPHELFNKSSKIATVKIGDYIPSSSFSSSVYKKNVQIKLLKKHVYFLAKNKKVFNTEKNVIHPVDKKLLKKQLYNCEVLGFTEDKKTIFVAAYNNCPLIIREISRLREITFRKVGEGTGKRMDLDRFDRTYKHLILWDEKELEIVGSYRIGICSEIIEESGIDGLYTSTLFNISGMDKYLPYSIELGRSFIQSKYWTTNALDYLWQGIGSFLLKNQNICYMFGGVSLSNSYNEEAKNLIIYFFNKWFGFEGLAESRNKYIIPSSYLNEFQTLFENKNYLEELQIIKKRLKFLGFSVPTLYKQYTELCETGGIKFLDFGIDPDFNNCIDGLILVEVDKIKKSKKERYMKNSTLHTDSSYTKAL
ncbi:MAG TPA: lysophospholipid acyltransferase family protein [Ignavibacteriaceae bacterium]|nr:lysophospholipid acyltransferase family protein [Ignavibacteriaceae bacterium]